MKGFYSALAVGLLLVSCVPSTPQARIQKDPSKFEALTASQRNLVEQGRISNGMPPEAVYLAWGSPSSIMQGSRDNKTTERWDYAGSRPVYTTNFYGSYGYARGPYGRYGRYGYSGFGVGPQVAYIPYRYASVWFVDGRVDAWERAR